MNKIIRTRIAPSPTGSLHIGTIRATLFNWLFTRGNNGQFIIRIEDTDKERSKKEYEEEILAGFKWVGLQWDEGPDISGPYGPYRQSERRPIYKKEIEKLLERGFLYYCFCTKEELEVERQVQLAQNLIPRYSKKCRVLSESQIKIKLESKTPRVLRFKTPENQKISFNDLVRGKIEFESSTMGDMVVARDLDDPLFTLAGVIDDYYMKITHVIRGEDHLPNTPKQILLQEALGFTEPIYAHLPLVLSSDRKKLSKRFAEMSVFEYKKQGYLPEAILNFIALLGWHASAATANAATSYQLPASGKEKEIFSKEELIREFDLKRVQKAGAVFNIEKLDWLNSEHIKKLSQKELESKLIEFVPQEWVGNKNLFTKVVALIRPRIKKLTDFVNFAGFFFEMTDYDPLLLIWRSLRDSKDKHVKTLSSLKSVQEVLEKLREEDFYSSAAESILVQKISGILDLKDRGAILWPLRAALSGKEASPGPYEILSILGKEESLRRVEEAIKKLT